MPRLSLSTATAASQEDAQYLTDLHAASSGQAHRLVCFGGLWHVCTLSEARGLIQSGGEQIR